MAYELPALPYAFDALEPYIDAQTVEIAARSEARIDWRVKALKEGEATVRDVYEDLLERRKIAYTTVMTMMKVLEGKGHLKKRQDDRAYVYRPTRPEAAVVRGMVREFVDRLFDGAAHPLLVHLVKDRRLTKKELEELARTIEEA